MKNKVRKSAFNLTHEKQLTAKPLGALYPILCQPVLPGDQWKCNSEILARVVPLINPIYQRFDIFTHFYYVPNRLLWENWESFISPQIELGVEQNPTFPAFKIGETTNVASQTLAASNFNNPNFLSYICGGASAVAGATEKLDFSILPYRAMVQIWNEYYRDQDLQEKVTEYKNDGVTTAEFTELKSLIEDTAGFLHRNAEKDYFTSARPYAQKGTPANVGVEGYARVIPWNMDDATNFTRLNNADGTIPTGAMNATAFGTERGVSIVGASSEKTYVSPMHMIAQNNLGPMDAPDQNSYVTIEDIRYANTLQKYLEKLLKFGSKYHEMLRSVFGVTVPDYRVARPEYLGGGRQPVVVSEVLQTSQSETTPLGTFGGHAISSGNAGFEHFFPEHGIVIGLMSIMPRTKYLNGIPREFTKTDRYDFATPDFAHLGEQAVMEYEINGRIGGEMDNTFGYQERFAEYKFIPSTVHGMFRNDAILKTFHCAREGNEYQLDSAFLHVEQDPTMRVFAVEDYDPFLITMINNITALRPLPRHSNPSLTL